MQTKRLNKYILRWPHLMAFLLLLWFSKELKGQVSMQRSFFVEDSIDHTPLGFALMEYTKVSDPMHKKIQLRANSKGIIELIGAVAGDSINYKISLPGYNPYQANSLVKHLYLDHILLQSASHELGAVTIQSTTRKIHFKPGEMQISWNRFSKNPAEPIANVIKRIPGIINKSLDKNTLSLESSGGKKVSVFLDGRKLSDQEVQSLPSMMIAKASLVTFPSALDAGDKTAILYLSSNKFAYNYSFDDLNLNYDFGRTGPSFTLRHTQKKGLWSNNIMINAYHYAMPSSRTKINIDQEPYQIDSTVSTTNTILLMASITKKSVKNNLFTIGIYSNMFKGDADGYHTDFSNNKQTGAFSSHTKSSLINATVYAAWRYKTTQGNIWQIQSNGTFEPNHKSAYTVPGPDGIHSNTNMKEQAYSLGAKYTLKKTKLGKFDWNNSFSLGAKADHATSIRLFNQPITPEATKQNNGQYAAYGGISSAITNDKWKIETSLMGNYSWQNGYAFTHYSNGYIYPKIVLSYAPDDRQSLSLSLAASTLRPSLKMAVTDSNYTSNWVISKGNQAIEAEHDYHLDLLYNLSIGKFTFEAEGEQTYYDNGIVQSWVLIKSPVLRLLSTYHNIDYYDRHISLMTSYQPGDAFYLKWSGQLHHLSFRQQDLPANFKDGYYIESDLNISYYSNHAGNFALIGSWEGNPLIYLKKTETRPALSFSYDFDLSKTINLYAGFYDIFGSGDWKRTAIYGGLNQFTNANQRTLSLGITWKFGQQFGSAQAGSYNSSAIPQDTKKF